MMVPSFGFRIVQVTFAFAQNALIGGIIFGWASIDRTLLIASKEGGGANLTKQETTHIFIWASSLSMGSALLLGILLDICGPRVCSVISCLIIALGAQLVAYYDGYHSVLGGMCMIAFGGPGIISSIIHVSNLFPKYEYMVISTLTGSISISFSVFAVFDMIWEQHPSISYQMLFGYFGLLSLLFAVAAFFIYPDQPFDKIDLEDAYEDLQLEEHEKTMLWHEDAELHGPPQSLSQTPSLHVEPLDSYLRDEYKMPYKSDSFVASRDTLKRRNSVSSLSLKDRPFIEQVKSGPYARSLLVFMFCCYSANFSIASVSTELDDTNHFSQTVQRGLTRDFTFIMSVGTIASIFAGAFIDHFGVVTATVVTLVIGQLEMLAIIFAGEQANMMELSFYLYTLFRQFLYPVFIASLTDRLGFKYFGVLLGTGFALGGIIQLTQTALIDLVDSNHQWNVLHWVFFFIFGLLLVFPAMDAKQNKIRAEKIKAAQALRDAKPSPKVDYGT